jgi:hypothetical protein
MTSTTASVAPVMSLLPPTPAGGPVAAVVTDVQEEQGAAGSAPFTPTAPASQAGKPAAGEDLSALTCPQLRELCKQQNLGHKGKKVELLVRLGSESATPAKQPPDTSTVKCDTARCRFTATSKKAMFDHMTKERHHDAPRGMPPGYFEKI